LATSASGFVDEDCARGDRRKRENRSRADENDAFHGVLLIGCFDSPQKGCKSIVGFSSVQIKESPGAIPATIAHECPGEQAPTPPPRQALTSSASMARVEPARPNAAA
jgi:hypothetical protein